MSPLFQWQEPRAALDSQWRIYCKLFNNAGSTLFTVVFGFAVIYLFAFFYWGKKIYYTPFLFIGGLLLYFWGESLLRRHSFIVLTDKGIKHHRFLLIPWKNIELYSIDDCDYIATSIRQIKLKARGKWYKFYFDAQRTNETDLRGVLNQFLPQREMVQL